MRPTLLVCALLLAATLQASHRIEDPRHNYAPIDPGTNPGVLLERSYELELRRPGGPRSEVLERMLKLKAEASEPAWGNEVIAACEQHAVDCHNFLGEAERRAGAEKKHPGWAAAQVSAIRQEAELQGMTSRQRHALYEQAISNGSAKADDVTLLNVDATRRAWEEGFGDVLPLARQKMAQWRESDRLAASPYLEVAEAAASADPAGALARLVRASVESEIAGMLNPNRVVTTADEVRRGTAKVALRELRRLNLTDAVDGLKKVLELYEPVKQKYQRIPAEIRASGRYPLASEVPSPTAYLGFVGWEIAEAIGDLGDRDFERKTLGGRTLWDQVNEAERELVRQGKLHQSEMVSK